MPKQARAAVFILPRPTYSFLTESYLPLTLNLQRYVQPQISIVYNSCYHLVLSRLFELSQTFSIFITWLSVGSSGVDFSTSVLPLDDKSKTTGAVPSPWSDWLHKWPSSQLWDERSGKNFLSKESHRKNCCSHPATSLRLNKANNKMAERR